MAEYLLHFRPMNALVAFDKFKDALSADEACSIAAAALLEVHPQWAVEQAPLADGGDGFCHALCHAANGVLETVTVPGPLGEPTPTAFGIVPIDALPEAARSMLDLPTAATRLAVLEMAQSSGIALLPTAARSPWTTSTYGLGRMMLAAVEAGADALLVGVGGSATHDLGLGVLQAIGFRFHDRQGKPIATPPTPLLWDRLGSIDRPEAPVVDLPIRVACDVSNPLVGPNGAAAVFGAQKGLKPTDFDLLDSLTSRAAVILCHATEIPLQAMDTPGSGAAGGCAFGLMAGLGARLVPGAELVAAWTDIDSKLDRAQLVLTGEGRFDASSLQGKGPGYALEQAQRRGLPCLVFAGSLGELPDEALAQAEFTAISPPDLSLAEAIAATPQLLADAIRAAFEARSATESRQFSANRNASDKAQL